MDQITSDDVETTKFHEWPYSRNCAIRTLRRRLGKAGDWKLIREVPRIKSVKVFPRDRMVTVEDERRLLGSCPRPLRDVLTIMLDSGLRNGEVIRMRLEQIIWESAFYFNPKGKTRKARRLVPLSERVIALLRNIQLEQSGQRGAGLCLPRSLHRSHRTERDRAHLPKACSKARNPRRLEAVLRATHLVRWQWRRRGIRDWSKKSWGARAWTRQWAISTPRRLRSKWSLIDSTSGST
jgi:integrase